MLSLLAQDELLSHELQQCAAETVKLVAALGGQATAYRRERMQAVQRMVAEVYGAPRVTRTTNLLPSQRILPGFAPNLSGECSRAGGDGRAITSGREAREAAVHKLKLCRSILEDHTRQLQVDGRLQPNHYGVHGLWDDDAGNYTTAQAAHHDQPKVLALTNPNTFKDSVTGQLLPEALVQAARKLELDYFEKKRVWDKVPRSEAWQEHANDRSPFGGSTLIKVMMTHLTFAAGSSRAKSARLVKTRSLHQLHHWRTFEQSYRWLQRTSKTHLKMTETQPALTGSRYRSSISAEPTSARPLIRTIRHTLNYHPKTQTTGSWWAACANTCTARERRRTVGIANTPAV